LARIINSRHMNAKGVEPIDKQIQGQPPRVLRKTSPNKLEINQTL